MRVLIYSTPACGGGRVGGGGSEGWVMSSSSHFGRVGSKTEENKDTETFWDRVSTVTRVDSEYSSNLS